VHGVGFFGNPTPSEDKKNKPIIVPASHLHPTQKTTFPQGSRNPPPKNPTHPGGGSFLGTSTNPFHAAPPRPPPAAPAPVPPQHPHAKDIKATKAATDAKDAKAAKDAKEIKDGAKKAEKPTKSATASHAPPAPPAAAPSSSWNFSKPAYGKPGAGTASSSAPPAAAKVKTTTAAAAAAAATAKATAKETAKANKAKAAVPQQLHQQHQQAKGGVPASHGKKGAGASAGAGGKSHKTSNLVTFVDGKRVNM
jgi:hypothetical protein